jgi:urocanate hydratase
VANVADVMDALIARGITPDIVTDQTTTDPIRGYIPRGMTAVEADDLRASARDELIRRADATLIDHIRAMLEFQRRGAEVFEYGNGLRARAQMLGVSDAFEMGVFTERYIRPLFCEGIGPFRWLAISGDPEDISTVDDIILEHFAGEPITHWITAARAAVQFTGLPARIGWLGYGDRRKLGLLVNDAVASGRISGPIAFTRDHLDSGSVAAPLRETERMLDGSDGIADWPILNALLNTASHADLVAVHGFGGMAQSAGATTIADGSPQAAEKLSAVLTNDPGIGVLRHADAGYETAIATAARNGLGF